MPQVGDQSLTPDEALAKDLCPECGRPLAETNPAEHVSAHWPKGAGDEGHRRAKLILEWEKAHPKEPVGEDKK